MQTDTIFVILILAMGEYHLGGTVIMAVVVMEQ
jgi:hypothetical protein